METGRNVDRLFKRKRWLLTLTYASVMGCTLGLVGYAFDRIVTNLSYRSVEKEIASLASNIHDNVEYKLATPGKIPADLYARIPELCPIYLNCQTQWQQQHRHTLVNIDRHYASFIDTWGKTRATLGIHPNVPKPSLSSLENSRWDHFHDRMGKGYQQLTLEIHTPDNQVWGYLQVGRDLTDIHEYLNNIHLFLTIGIIASEFIVVVVSWYLAGLAMRPLSQSYQQMQKFTADAAHELRTPLATLQVIIENGRAEYQHLAPELTSWLDQIERQNIRISSLVNDLLFLSSLDRPDNKPNLEPCCLTEIVLDLVEEFAIPATAKSIDICSDLDLDAQIWIDGNSEQLYRMGANLVDNAIKYTPAGGKVAISLTQNLNDISLQVKDNGIGISDANKVLIFNRFHRIESKSSPPQHSTGLGLAIVKSIVDVHGGQLTVWSQVDKGSIFTVKFISSLKIN
ncbi:two-component system sensor histidine kinase RppB [Chamaesiphon minutus]|uniref:histidine kinase n=1 Tax=Chamaesiphon minutus (strain ATCC 27169 / PCC 6605) TaxID=1173020 RepID=K9UEX0_CHAP6|nr:two-component system sensor histidine kinase RppB [Chamaesiphon minutus]AFY92971.1 signal transduction histidine kinase [Chamaesiphon minutus PCC 6605]